MALVCSRTLMDDIANLIRLGEIVGPEHVGTGADIACRSDDFISKASMRALSIVLPSTTSEVTQTLAYSNSVGLKAVAQGGRTGLSGGARITDRDVALSLERMRKVEPIDSVSDTVVVEAGVTPQTLQDAAEAASLYYPVDWDARGSATIAGSIATNAGGNSVFRFGMTHGQIPGL